MNIFENYLLKIEKVIKSAHKDNLLELPDNLSGINVDIPPAKFTGDISTNVAMVLSKINKKTPLELAKQIAELIKDSDNNIDEISIEKPGFINLKFKNEFWNGFILDVLNNSSYGSSTSGKKNSYLVEFVSANPTGPLHVGHSRGAILGDVISNLLSFNGHKVTKEYYVNDYGNQISHFTKSVYLRIKEILYDETFPIDDKELYPGDYLIDIAKKIISKNKDLDFKNFESVSENLKKLSIQESLKLIKINLENLGIKHDNFASETDIINNNEVDEVIKNLKDKKYIYEGKIKAPEGESKENWVEREQLLFKSTDFGDDKDRALQKEDKSWTYFASDVAYHNTKLKRDFNILINILGADPVSYTHLTLPTICSV